MRGQFKAEISEDIRTLWFSYRGRLVTVSTYPYEQDGLSEDEWDAIYERDARIFLRGFNYRQ